MPLICGTKASLFYSTAVLVEYAGQAQAALTELSPNHSFFLKQPAPMKQYLQASQRLRVYNAKRNFAQLHKSDPFTNFPPSCDRSEEPDQLPVFMILPKA